MSKNNTKVISPVFAEKNDAAEPDKSRELHEILALTLSVRKRLEQVIFRCEEAGDDVSELDEAADALSDAAEILEDALGDFE